MRKTIRVGAVVVWISFTRQLEFKIVDLKEPVGLEA